MPRDAACPKCGKPTVVPLPRLDAAMEQALGPPAAEAVATPRPWRRIAAAGLGVVALGLLGTFLWFEHQENDALPYFPLAAGRSWLMHEASDATHRFRGTLVRHDSVDGHPAWVMQVDETTPQGDRPLGQAWLETHLRGFDFLGVDGPGIGRHLFDMRMAAWPLTAGHTWTWEWRESFTSLTYRGTFSVVSDHEPVDPGWAHFDTVHIHSDLGQKLIGTQVSLDYWLAPQVGPVRFKISAPGNLFGIQDRDLMLDRLP